MPHVAERSRDASTVSGRQRPGHGQRGPGLAAAPGEPAGRAAHAAENPKFDLTAKAAARAAQGAGHDLAVHARRPQPRRPARSQARAHQAQRQRLSGRGRLQLRQSRQQEAASAAPGSSPSTASAAPRFPNCCRTWPTIVDDVAVDPLDAHRHQRPRAVDLVHEHRQAAARPAGARLVAHLWPR